MKFIDEAIIEVCAGRGGDAAAAAWGRRVRVPRAIEQPRRELRLVEADRSGVLVDIGSLIE